MINIRVPEEKDKNKIIDLLTSEKVNNFDLHNEILNNSMAVYDGDKILGYSSYKKLSNKNMALIDLLIVKQEYRGQYIGDGLIKAILNLADKRQIKKVYLISHGENSIFYEKAGLIKRKIEDCKEIIKYIGNELGNEETVEVFQAILPDFFNKACKSSR
ncbi:GNAT family N-acetyltransferase [Maledivibacter halophilus]|uniref:Amino-acid N-acetyltransferase n=1 Tax=Maledivibacter halophilus TaxID=36842 RepID=A0A1T5LA53_9FIRM|nr:GNAT family N-acetyltransferase [Maledivibacter halophilus]SKC72833.1 amino-acid N-acetyltransferase [Maledivibacter halophilus]